jgi:hypothetical protein
MAAKVMEKAQRGKGRKAERRKRHSGTQAQRDRGGEVERSLVRSTLNFYI